MDMLNGFGMERILLGLAGHLVNDPSSDPEFKATCETLGVCEAAYKSGDYDNDSEDFRMFVADAEKPLFEGSESTKL